MEEQSLILDIFKIAPGIAGAVVITYFAFKHIRGITNDFVDYIKERDKQLQEEAEANRQAWANAQQTHAEHFKDEQERFFQERERERKTYEETMEKLVEKYK